MQSVVLIVGAAAGAAILLVHFVVAAGAVMAWNISRRVSKQVDERTGLLPGVSVVIPARNEEKLLPRLLSSLEQQDYDGFEVVLVDDRSTDSTHLIMERFRDRHPDRVRVVTVPPTPEPLSNPKQRALLHGTLAASGDVILFTDADCEAPESWVRHLSACFRDPKMGVVFGPVMPADRGPFAARYQSFDHIFRFYYTAGSAGLGNPTGGFGNNLGVRKAALAAVGGFGALRYSVTEDAELIAEVRDLGCWKIMALIHGLETIHPEPQLRWRDMVSQSVRWNTGGLFAPDRATRYSYRTVMLFLFVSVILLPFGCILPGLMFTTAGSFLSMVLLAVMAGAFSGRPLRYWAMLLPNVIVSMFYYTYVTFITLFGTGVVWKDSKLGSMIRG